jgi:FMN phosphatase YigB (HAD superfamily)
VSLPAPDACGFDAYGTLHDLRSAVAPHPALLAAFRHLAAFPDAAPTLATMLAPSAASPRRSARETAHPFPRSAGARTRPTAPPRASRVNR